MADDGLSGWARFVGEILDGRVYGQPYVRIGLTPLILQQNGFGPHNLIITPGKIVRIVKDHPEITRKILRDLPNSLRNPVAILPSARRDGTLISVLVLESDCPDPILVPIFPAPDRASNIVMSVYAKPQGMIWIEREIEQATRDKVPFYARKGFAATLPKPGSASEDTIPSSPGPIPADGTTKPERRILRLREKSSDE